MIEHLASAVSDLPKNNLQEISPGDLYSEKTNQNIGFDKLVNDKDVKYSEKNRVDTESDFDRLIDLKDKKNVEISELNDRPDFDKPVVWKNENTDVKDQTKENKSLYIENNENKIDCRNKDLAGQKHPETDIPFEEKTVKDADGNDVTGVFPKFDSKFDVQLPEDLYQASDKKQFDESNKQLKDKCESDPEFSKQFSSEQLEQIKNGDTPDGYTWHHNEETGKMQLVDSDIHARTGHTGGKTIWGGGTEKR